ncbi:uracil phosphoribosyltransferase [Desulfurococcus amylolyticus]|uniref:uracil phosphoribosyltransferase n=1 Tax=Desulfurococcus amylolyticus TaxID=94694 RepID=UPI0005B1F94A|nr:uracil phosphoribosyltransferase [Desulfurococcus amylolyticus]
MGRLIVIDNPLAKYYLTLLRKPGTTPGLFREYMRKLGFIMGYEVSRLLEWDRVFVDSDHGRAEGFYPYKPVYIIGVLGASIPFTHGLWDAMPWAGLGLVAARRVISENRVDAEIYYERMPSNLTAYTVIVVDPTLATGRTMVRVVEEVRARGGGRIIAATVLASRYGVEYFHSRFDEIPLLAIEVDPVLDKNYFIMPGIGDAGDRSLSADMAFEPRLGLEFSEPGEDRVE